MPVPQLYTGFTTDTKENPAEKGASTVAAAAIVDPFQPPKAWPSTPL